MKTTATLILAALAALPAHGYMGMQAQETAPKSLKGKRITFFFEGARRFVVDKKGFPQPAENKLTLRYVNFNYGNTSNGKNGGKMVYENTLNEEEGMTLYDQSYSGSGYRIKGNPSNDSGAWTLYFELDNLGSAQFFGTEDGQTVVYEDVLFKVTPVNQDATIVDDGPVRSTAPTSMPQPQSVAPVSMEKKVIVVKPKPGQDLASQPWALSLMVFGRPYMYGGRLVNHMVACKPFGENEVCGPNWRNALNGETEPVLFPGYYDYERQSANTARIQISGEGSANAYYQLTFTSPTSGTLLFHCEDVVDDKMQVVSHLEDIPFEVQDDY